MIARLTPPLEAARGLSPEEAARAIHGAMEDASRDTVRMLLRSMSQYAPLDGERPQPYLLRLSESLILEFLSAEFSAGTLGPVLCARRSIAWAKPSLIRADMPVRMPRSIYRRLRPLGRTTPPRTAY